MKVSSTYAFLALLSAVSAEEACVEGKRVTISPGHTVEYKCGKYRLGQTHRNIRSHDDCAALCRDEHRSVCSYHAARNMCVVGDENGKEGSSPGSTYMVRVEEHAEDPFAEDPFKQTCEEARDECLGRETTQTKDLSDCRGRETTQATELSACHGRETTQATELSKCRADLATASKPRTCGVAKWGKEYYEVKAGMRIADCKKQCQADAKCLSYSANSGTTGAINCYLYGKVTSEVPHQTYPNFVQYDKSCP
ncbi:hypothetical protein G6O67_003155 [Ophiocordyceps sinensis]|uniref:Apple domain-containing protein n=2 Tax=Ophiocordyceps sinensis TaxID=72228 RepID=A0A8H4PVP1_9HYPO|nr:hypothetical protein OCS_01578 [Ophiocordyceps sinensis CO18]KAF4511349.1 hypothetical protein G6O67_003155 [Ophiocordyceps sinensis]